MFKKSLNISVFILSISIPLSMVLFISNRLNMNIDYLVPMITGLTFLFALEIAQTLSNLKSMRKILNNNREKLLFSACLATFLFLFTLPIKYDFSPWYIQYVIQVFGILVFALYMIQVKNRQIRE